MMIKSSGMTFLSTVLSLPDSSEKKINDVNIFTNANFTVTFNLNFNPRLNAWGWRDFLPYFGPFSVTPFQL